VAGDRRRADNRRSIRALEKAGFRFAGRIATEEGPEHLLVADRTIRP
jgi:RimJ/RimL family protein N-acetyltransferase